MTLHQNGRFEVLTGVNLPMVIKVMQLIGQERDLIEVARQAHRSAARSIVIASDVLVPKQVPRKVGA